MSSGNFSVSNNLSVGNNVTCNALTATSATIPTLAVNNLTVSGTTNIGVFQSLTMNDLTTNTITSTGQVTAPTILVGTKNVGTTLTTLQSDMATAQTNITNLQTKTTNQSYAPSTQTTTILGTVATPALTLNGVDLNTRITASETNITTLQGKTANQTASGTTTTFTGTVAGITKAMVGLGNVDNTSDVNKPVSTATQTALNLKANIASPTFTGTVSGITKAMVGLGNVDNTSDVNKPVSTATQTALDLKANIASPTFTGTVTAPTTNSTSANIGTVNANYLVTKDITAGSTKQSVIYQSNSTVYYAGQTNSTNHVFVTLDSAGNQSTPLTMNSTSSTFSNNVVANNITASTQMLSKEFELDSVFNTAAISAPAIIQGIGNGTGDGATTDWFNQGIFSWYGTGFVDTCTKACRAVVNHRTGDIRTTGGVTSNTVTTGTTSTNYLVAKDILPNSSKQSSIYQSGSNVVYAGQSNSSNHLFTVLDSVGNQTTPLTISSNSVSVSGSLVVDKVNSNTPLSSHIAGFVRGTFGFQPIFGSVADTASYGAAVVIGGVGREIVTNVDQFYVIFPKYKIVPYKSPGYGATAIYGNIQAYDNTNGTAPIYVNAAANDVGSIKVYYNNVEVVVAGLS